MADPSPKRFARLPEPTPREATIASQDVRRDPEHGDDQWREIAWMLKNASG